jgi:2-polyprenyl-6-methoxyphenol hydroxylase-like FAD-dependent oxidoreductase
VIIIAGAGIGGLTLGCALARAGRPFRILERAVELRPAGAGIALSENALRALAHIGLADAVRACGQDLAVAAICDQHGRALIEHRVREITRRSGNHVHSVASAFRRKITRRSCIHRSPASLRLYGTEIPGTGIRPGG